MLLTEEVIRSLIIEEISNLLVEELSPDQERVAGQIISMLSAQNAKEEGASGKIMAMVNDTLSAQDPSAANRSDVQESCGDMQSIDMAVEPTHSKEDHEGSMAKRQMYKTAEYAAEIFEMVEEGEELPAWIQSKMTKIADYIGAVKHYLEYDHVMGEKLDKDADAGDYVKDFQDSDAPQFKGKSKKKKQQMAVAAYLNAKED